MLKKIKNILLAITLSLTLATVLTPAYANAQASKQDLRCGINSAAGESGCSAPGNAQTTVNTIIRRIINITSVVIGVIAVIMIMIAGFRYITSGGDSSRVGSAKNALLYALVGLIVVALAQVLVKFVLKETTR